MLIPVQDHKWLDSILTAQDKRLELTLDSIPFYHRVLPHAHPQSLRHVDMPVNLMHTFLECERKLEQLEKIHADVGRPYKLYTHSGPGQESFFFLSYQHYKEVLFIEMVLFNDLLFMIFMYLNIMELVFFL